MNHTERVNEYLRGVVLTPREAAQIHHVVAARTLTDEIAENRPTVTDAIAAVTAASYEVVDPGSHENGMRIVHTVNDLNLGADHRLEDIIRTIRVAGRTRLAWNVRTDRHRLTIDRGHAGALHVDTTPEAQR